MLSPHNISKSNFYHIEMEKDQPPKKKRQTNGKVKIACLNCRTRKIKCSNTIGPDGNLTTCTNCMIYGCPCEYVKGQVTVAKLDKAVQVSPSVSASASSQTTPTSAINNATTLQEADHLQHNKTSQPLTKTTSQQISNETEHKNNVLNDMQTQASSTSISDFVNVKNISKDSTPTNQNYKNSTNGNIINITQTNSPIRVTDTSKSILASHNGKDAYEQTKSIKNFRFSDSVQPPLKTVETLHNSTINKPVSETDTSANVKEGHPISDQKNVMQSTDQTARGITNVKSIINPDIQESQEQQYKQEMDSLNNSPDKDSHTSPKKSQLTEEEIFAMNFRQNQILENTKENYDKSKENNNGELCKFLLKVDNQELRKQIDTLLQLISMDATLAEPLKVTINQLQYQLSMLDNAYSKDYVWNTKELNAIKHSNKVSSVESQILRNSKSKKIHLTNFNVFTHEEVTHISTKNADTDNFEDIESAETASTSTSGTNSRSDTKITKDPFKDTPGGLGVYSLFSLFTKNGISVLLKHLNDYSGYEIKSENAEEPDRVCRIVSERELKETLYIFLKYAQYFLTNVNISYEMWSSPLDCFFINVMPMLDVKTDFEKCQELLKMVPIAVIDESFKFNPKFKSVYKNFAHFFSNATQAPLVFQWFEKLLDLHIKGIYHKTLVSVTEIKSVSEKIPEPIMADIWNDYHIEEAMNALVIYQFHRTLYGHMDSLEFLESLLSFFRRKMWCESSSILKSSLSFIIRIAQTLGLDRWEYYTGIDEELSERQRVAFWECSLWDVYISVQESTPTILNFSTLTSFYPKFMIDIGIVGKTSLYNFLAKEGYKFIDLDLNLKSKFLITCYTQIMADFNDKVLYNAKYTSINIMVQNGSNDLLFRELLDDIDYFQKYFNVLQLWFHNLNKEIKYKGFDNREQTDEYIWQIKFMGYACSYRTHMLYCCTEMVSRYSKAIGPEVLENSEYIDYTNLVNKYNMYVDECFKSSLSVFKLALRPDRFIALTHICVLLKRAMINIVCIHIFNHHQLTEEFLQLILTVLKNYYFLETWLFCKEFAKNRWVYKKPATLMQLKYDLTILCRILCQLYQEQEKMNKEDLLKFVSRKKFTSNNATAAYKLDDILAQVLDANTFEFDQLNKSRRSMNRKKYKKYLSEFAELSDTISSKVDHHSSPSAHVHTVRGNDGNELQNWKPAPLASSSAPPLFPYSGLPHPQVRRMPFQPTGVHPSVGNSSWQPPSSTVSNQRFNFAKHQLHGKVPISMLNNTAPASPNGSSGHPVNASPLNGQFPTQNQSPLPAIPHQAFSPNVQVMQSPRTADNQPYQIPAVPAKFPSVSDYYGEKPSLVPPPLSLNLQPHLYPPNLAPSTTLPGLMEISHGQNSTQMGSSHSHSSAVQNSPAASDKRPAMPGGEMMSMSSEASGINGTPSQTFSAGNNKVSIENINFGSLEEFINDANGWFHAWGDVGPEFNFSGFNS